MDKRLSFSKIKVEETLDQFFSPQGGRMVRANDKVLDSHYNRNAVPCPGTFSNTIHNPNSSTMYKGNASQISTEMMQQCMPNNTAGYANSFNQSKCVQGTGYTSYYYQSNNPQLESNLSDEQQALEYCNTMMNSTSYEKTDPYFVPKKYKRDDQLKHNTMYYQDGKSKNPRIYRDDDAARIGPRFGGHFNTPRSRDDEWLSHSQRHDELAKNNSFPTKINNFDRNFESFKRNKIEVNDEHHFQTHTLRLEPSPDPSFDRSSDYNRLSRANKNVGRFRRISGERQSIQKLDDGFVCVRNPDFFPESRGDNEHMSRHTRHSEHHGSNGKFRIKTERTKSEDRSFKKSEDRSFSSFERSSDYNRLSRANENVGRFRRISGERQSIQKLDDGFVCVRKIRTRSPNFSEKTGKGKQSERVRKFQESIKLKRENLKLDKGDAKVRTITKKIDDNQANEDISFRKYHWKKGDNTINPKDLLKTNAKLYSKYTYINKRARGIPKQTIPSSGGSKLKASENIPKEKRILSKIERQKLYFKIKVQKKIAIAKSYRKQCNNRKQKRKELRAVGLLGSPCEGQIKYQPEKYWTTWWSKYAYVENAIDKVDADSLADHLKFRCDLNDPTLDCKINHIYNTALTQIQLTSTITEVNYERRTDAFATLKYLKILEDKEFQSFLLSKESKHIGQVLKEERENKRRQALLYQNVICCWHQANALEKNEENLSEETLPEGTLSEETLPEGTLSEETLPEGTLSEQTLTIQQRKQARSLQKYELYHYMVLDSINELKKLTAEDWPGFKDFYKTLK